MEKIGVEENNNIIAEKTAKSIKAVRDFLDDAKEGVLAIDEEGIILYINSMIKKLIQKEESEVIGKKYQEIIGGDSSEAIQALESAHMQTLKILAETQSREKTIVEKLKLTQRNLIDLITTFVKVIEAHDPYMQGHSARVARYAMMLSKKMGMPAQFIQNMAYAGLFHDLGMIMVPSEIINKATSLTIKEYVIVKKHPAFSVKYIENIELFKDIIPTILHHHERWDGNGYPDGLKAENIPVGARILFVAEAYDAIVSKRPYRRARTREEAVSILKENRGTQFDPLAVDNFLFLLQHKVI